MPKDQEEHQAGKVRGSPVSSRNRLSQGQEAKEEAGSWCWGGGVEPGKWWATGGNQRGCPGGTGARPQM